MHKRHAQTNLSEHYLWQAVPDNIVIEKNNEYRHTSANTVSHDTVLLSENFRACKVSSISNTSANGIKTALGEGLRKTH